MGQARELLGVRILVCDEECLLPLGRYPIKEGLEDLGHRVDMFDWSYYFPSHTSERLTARVKTKMIKKVYLDRINRDLSAISVKGKYDLVIVLLGKYIYPETIQKLSANSGCIVNWNSDDVLNMKSSSVFVVESVPIFDIHFTPRPHLIPELHSMGARRVESLDWYFRPGLLNMSTPIESRRGTLPISFVGSWSKQREALLAPLMMHGASFFGSGWSNRATSLKSDYANRLHQAIPLQQVHQIFSESSININSLTHENRDVTNLRNFEIPAAGSFQLAERSEQLLELFEEDLEVVCFSDQEEMLDKCSFYLTHETARQAIATAGWIRLVKSDYSLKSRLNKIVQYCVKESR